jgi:ell wall binding domain 2 (CWB2)
VPLFTRCGYRSRVPRRPRLPSRPRLSGLRGRLPQRPKVLGRPKLPSSEGSAETDATADAPTSAPPVDGPATTPPASEAPTQKLDPVPAVVAAKPAAEAKPSLEDKPADGEPETAPQSEEPPTGKRSRRRRAEIVVAALAGVAAIAVGGYFAGKALFDNNNEATVVPPAPVVVVHHGGSSSGSQQAPAAADVGFPEFATNNTTRVGGVDPASDAAGVALAVHPSSGKASAVTLIPDDSWEAGVAAASLVAAPVGAPILISSRDEVPPLTADALSALAPTGSAATDNKQLFIIDGAKGPAGATTASVDAPDAARLAVGIAALRQKLVNAPPDHLLLVSSKEAAYAMPAAAWAARSGDPVLFVEKSSVPSATLAALRRYAGTPTYLLAPPSVVNDATLKAIQKIAPQTQRISGDDPVASAVAFARFSDGTFGWNINDPGHGFVIANTSRPLDAAAAAPLSASGTWGPLLVTDTAAAPPPALASYLLDLKPGYADDPTRAVYNHVWLIGDETAISVPFQAQIDELAEVTKVSSGHGPAVGGPTGSETEQPPNGKKKKQ